MIHMDIRAKDSRVGTTCKRMAATATVTHSYSLLMPKIACMIDPEPAASRGIWCGREGTQGHMRAVKQNKQLSSNGCTTDRCNRKGVSISLLRFPWHARHTRSHNLIWLLHYMALHSKEFRNIYNSALIIRYLTLIGEPELQTSRIRIIPEQLADSSCT